MHEIQRHILKKLTLAKRARYADLKPKTVEGNLFTYHVRALMKERYLARDKGTYSLTLEGRRFADRVSFETFKERTQPKIVTLLVIEKAGKYLFYRRRRMPFMGQVGFPYGKIHLEERVAEAAERELIEKTGLTAALVHKGDVYLTVHDETELVSHMLCHVFYGRNPKGTLQSASSLGECFWGKLTEVPLRDRMPGVNQIVKLLKGGTSPFFAEYFLNTTEN